MIDFLHPHKFSRTSKGLVLEDEVLVKQTLNTGPMMQRDFTSQSRTPSARKSIRWNDWKSDAVRVKVL